MKVLKRRESMHVRVMNLRNATNAVNAYQQYVLDRRLKDVPDEAGLHQMLEDLRREAGKSFRSTDIGTVIVREKLAADAYVGLLEVLRDAVVQIKGEK